MIRLVLLLCALAGYSTAAWAADALGEIRKSFTIDGKPIPPEIFTDFGDDIMSDNRPIIVTVDARGGTWWFDTPVPSQEILAAALTTAAGQRPQPELHIRADVRAEYDAVGRVVYAAQQAGLARIGFLTEPPP